MHRTRFTLAISIATSTIASLTIAPVASAQEAPRQRYHLPAQPLAASLDAVAKASGRGVLAPSQLLEGKQAPALDGVFTPQEAVDTLLNGSGLRARAVGGNLVIGRDAPSDHVASSEASDVLVTGSRIRGAPIASPVITLTSQAMREAGQASLGEVVRSIPQSFGGGQNPGIGVTVPATSGVNVGGGSTINLRGLGSDATLTLLNGHRMSYNGSRQGIDVSSLPLGAVDRIEIVADGASALYGSDAVAGVANIVLKPDFDGLETSARYGAATQGAYSEEQYGAVAGARWDGGGVVAAYKSASNARLSSSDRSFAASRPNVTIYPGQRRHAVTAAGHQALSDALTFEFDALYNKRWNDTGYPLNAAGDLSVSRSERDATSASWAVTPSLKLRLPGGWRIALTGTYGQETVFTNLDQFAGSVHTTHSFICYCNNGKSVELAADGVLFRIPAGDAKLAVGTGYRYNLLNAFQGAGNLQNVEQSQDSYYGYGELSLPLVSEAQGIPWIQRLSVSGAVRYERYPGVDGVATPKFGLIYAPTADLDLKTSWGRSFRAPTLFQQYQGRFVALYPVASLGGSGAASATALLLTGGNPSLTPETANTWTATLDYHPHFIAGTRLQVSYFSTAYKNRIVTPIAFTSQALSNGAYTALVTANPGSAAAAAVIASAVVFGNLTGAPYNPATVTAIIDNRSLNAGRQSLHGVDVLAGYKTDLKGGASLGVDLNASYLESDQQLFAGQAITQRAGLLFTPPHWRGRGGVTWINGPLTLNGTLSYIGGVDDTRTSSTVRLGSVTTLDLTARFALTHASGPLRNLVLSVSVQNALDDNPSTIATTSFSDTAYDSTNYSPIGRFVSAGLSKKW